MDTLKNTPLVSFLNEGPVSLCSLRTAISSLIRKLPPNRRLVFQALGFLSPMAPLSFEPVTEAHHSVFSQFPATLLGESHSVQLPIILSQCWCWFWFCVILVFLRGEACRARTTGRSRAESSRPDEVTALLIRALF